MDGHRDVSCRTQYLRNLRISLHIITMAARGSSAHFDEKFRYISAWTVTVSCLTLLSSHFEAQKLPPKISPPKKPFRRLERYKPEAYWDNPIKCFVSHRPTDPIFWKSKKHKKKEKTEHSNNNNNNNNNHNNENKFPDLSCTFFGVSERSFNSCNYYSERYSDISIALYRPTIQAPVLRVYYQFPLVSFPFSFSFS